MHLIYYIYMFCSVRHMMHTYHIALYLFKFKFLPHYIYMYTVYYIVVNSSQYYYILVFETPYNSYSSILCNK